MKKFLTILILAIILTLITISGVNATSNDDLADTLYNMGVKYGVNQSHKVKIERYLADYPVTEAEANAIVEKAKEAVKVMEDAGTVDYRNLTAAQKEQIKTIAIEAGKIIDVTVVFNTNSVDIYKDGKLIESISLNSIGKLAYTGNNNIVLVVSLVAVIALVSVAVARKKLANA